MTVDVVAVGGCTVDIVHSADGTTRGRQLGGSAIYAAAGARVWGLRPGVVAFRGTGMPAGWTEMLTASGIDMQGLIPVDLAAAVAEFSYDADGSRTQRAQPADGASTAVPSLPGDTAEPIRRLRLAPERVPPEYLRARGAHLAPMRLDAQRAMAKALAALGVITLDPYAHVMAEATDEGLRALLAPVTAFLPSLEEVRARFPNADAGQGIDRLRALTLATVAVKQGRSGVLVDDRAAARRYVVPAVPVTARDPTGGGDAFCGGFIAGLVEGRSVSHAAAWGVVSASFTVEEFGLNGVLQAEPAERDRRLRWVLEHIA